ncbi:hypothetical protein [uncultured Candidatus Kuenenia sp.]|uniref:hypothetical protein n=1 Tax=uncultured Candidatus Kuenenia sp. TaxID=1048336 RepID=UPI0025CF92A8|nr:hypothetical protein [uncultured Candidatus Kuenenia sp.]
MNSCRNDIAEIKLRAERRIGEFSKELPKNEYHEGSNQHKKVVASHDVEPPKTKTSILKEAGITHLERF